MNQVTALQDFWCPFIENDKLKEDNYVLLEELTELEERYDVSKARLDYCIHSLNLQIETLKQSEGVLDSGVISTVRSREINTLRGIIKTLSKVF